MVLLELKDITKTFIQGQLVVPVLHDITLNIEAGEMLAITGPSGSGKSTLMNIIGCLDRPTTGSYFFEGKNVMHLSADTLAHIRNQKIGFAFQQFNLLDDLTALDNVALPRLYDDSSEKEARKKAAELLALMGITDRSHHYPNQLSGGQQQRVAIARALVNDPSLILADEPTGNLDSKSGAEVLDLFVRLNAERNMTVILVTHDLAIAQRTRRRIELLDGRIIKDVST